MSASRSDDGIGNFDIELKYDKNGSLFDTDVKITGGVTVSILGEEVAGSISFSGDNVSITLPGIGPMVYSKENIASNLQTDLEILGFSSGAAASVAHSLATIQVQVVNLEETISGVVPGLPGLNEFDAKFESPSYVDKILIGGSDHGFYGADGLDFISGGMGADVFYGGAGNDMLVGGAGADRLDGGAGNDVLIFDQNDMSSGLVDGGAGVDIGFFDGENSAINVDMQNNKLEILISGSGDDTFATDGTSATLISGGAGKDTFNINISGHSPTIVWGGVGSDVVSITEDSDRPLGILNITITGLTEDNFSLLSLSALGLPADFDWGQIDVILVNAESDDSLIVNGQDLRATEHNETVKDTATVSIENGDQDAVSRLQRYISAGYQIISDESYTITQGYDVETGTYIPLSSDDIYTIRSVELELEAETGATILTIDGDDDDDNNTFLYDFFQVQGSFLSSQEIFKIISSNVDRSYIDNYRFSDADF